MKERWRTDRKVCSVATATPATGFLPFIRLEFAYVVNGTMTPNWRERSVCPFCGLNNRIAQLSI